MATARPKQFKYRTSTEWTGQKRCTLASEGKPELECATPPEFKGHEGVWSPEDLQVAALDSCILMTFLYHAEQADIEVVSYRSEAEGVLEMQAGGLVFTEFAVRPQIIVAPGQKDAAQEAIHKAAESCLVHRSLSAQVHLEAVVRERGPA